MVVDWICLETATYYFVEEAGEGDAEAGSGAENSNKKSESRKNAKVGFMWSMLTVAPVRF